MQKERIMGQLSEKERELVALGAALGSNCIPCIVYHVGVAKKAGIADEALEEAIALADKVRKVPAEQVLKSAYAQIGRRPEASPGRAEHAKPDCGCSDP
jgi:AhpD family alkylhydroperoxidase